MSEHADEHAAIPVEIVADSTAEKIDAAVYGGWTSFNFPAANGAPLQILRFNKRRKRAVITITSLVGTLTGVAVLGSQNQINNGFSAGIVGYAGYLLNGSSITVESASEIWATNIINDVCITVLDESYRDD